jgi:proline iminopeptidase
MRSIDIDGFKLRYQVEGSGLPTIVVGSAVEHPRTFSSNLREHLQLIFVDHRGFTRLPDGVDPASIGLATIVEDIELVRQALGLTRFAIAGHSGNAYMALEYAKKYPAYVSHVIMICIAPDLGPQTSRTARRHWEESASPERKAQLAENYRRMPDDQLARMPADERFIEADKRMAPLKWYDYLFDHTQLLVGIVRNAIIEHVWGRIFSTIDITTGLEEFDRPVFLALGRYDFLVGPPSLWDPVSGRFKDLTIRVFEESGHVPQFEEPELFDRELLAWMNNSRAPTHAP